MSREAAEVALAALESELSRTERAIEASDRHGDGLRQRRERFREAIKAVHAVLMRPDAPPKVFVMQANAYVADIQVPPAPPLTFKADRGSRHLLDTPAAAPGRTVRFLILQALRVHDLPGGLNPMAVAAIIAVDKNHVHQELCHLTKDGAAVRVGKALYRIAPQAEDPNGEASPL